MEPFKRVLRRRCLTADRCMSVESERKTAKRDTWHQRNTYADSSGLPELEGTSLDATAVSTRADRFSGTDASADE